MVQFVQFEYCVEISQVLHVELDAETENNKDVSMYLYLFT